MDEKWFWFNNKKKLIQQYSMQIYSKINNINKIYQLNFQFCQLADKRGKFMRWIIIYEKKFILLLIFQWINFKILALFIVPMVVSIFLTNCTVHAWVLFTEFISLVKSWNWMLIISVRKLTQICFFQQFFKEKRLINKKKNSITISLKKMKILRLM